MTDADEFGSFVRTHARELQRTAWLLTGDWHSAQDLVQTALVSSWRRWDTITDAPVAYVRRVLLTDYLRGRRRRWTGEIATAELPEQVVDDGEGHDLRLQLQRALAALPPRQRAVIALRYFADLTEAQTADTLGCSVGAVKSHTAKAFATLRSAAGLAELLTQEVP